MKIEKNNNGNGFVVTNENGQFELSWGDRQASACSDGLCYAQRDGR